MYELRQTNGFKKDLKRAKKRGLDMTKLDEVVTNLVIDGKINRKFKPHKLKGNYAGYWECHIEPDWLLIWDQDEGVCLISILE